VTSASAVPTRMRIKNTVPIARATVTRRREALQTMER
jgi:hypothetical protein